MDESSNAAFRPHIEATSHGIVAGATGDRISLATLEMSSCSFHGTGRLLRGPEAEDVIGRRVDQRANGGSVDEHRDGLSREHIVSDGPDTRYSGPT
jgi:hypothetical protein